MPYAGTQIFNNDFLPAYHQGVRVVGGKEPIANLEQRSKEKGLQELELETGMPAIVSNAPLSRPLLFVAVVGGALVAAALGLWAYYGTAVFFEMVRAGWLACF